MVVFCTLYLFLIKVSFTFVIQHITYMQMFVDQCSYPAWTPVTVVIQDGEVWEFYSHFSSWPFVDLRLAEKSFALYLPVVKEPDIPPAASCDIKVLHTLPCSILN